MKLNRLLEKQLKKSFPAEYLEKEEFKSFINAINDSYNAYEKDLELSEHAFRITEEEYRELNNQLKHEVALKAALINKLKEAVTETGEVSLIESNDDAEILNIASYLKKQIISQRATENKLHDQKQFYEQILNRLPADIAVFDPRHRYLYVNPLGIKDAELRKWIIGKTDREYCIYRKRPVAIAEERERVFRQVVSSGQQKEWEDKMKNADGQINYHLRKMYPVYNEQNELELVIGYGVDITERKKIEEQVKLSEARYRNIFDYSLALICTHDLDGIILDVNNTAIATLGYTRDELIGHPLKQLIAADKRADFEPSYLSEIRNNGKAEGIMEAIGKNGKHNYLLYQNFLMTEDTEHPYVIGFSQDITARMDAERAVKKGEEKYRNIIANMNLGLLEVNDEERIVYANNSFCEMSGFDLDELIGRNAPSIFLKGENYEASKEVIQRRKQGASDAYELMIKDKRGELKWWLISGAPSFDEDGKLTGSIGIHLDITLQKTLEYELRQAKADAEHSAHAKEIFLANISHEMRTPMNAIMGIGKLLGKTEMVPQQTFYLNTIQTAANNLLVIINDLLDFSKIEAGKLTLEYIGFKLCDVMSNAVQMLKYKAEEKSLLINYELPSGLAPVLIGDPFRINQVLMNLLSNSIKFTESGGVKVHCTILSADSKTQVVEFKVVDTGIGMSKDYLANLFDKFSQEDESVSRKFGGTGLGMSITKQLIELMGGSIQVQSEKNVGTTISFALKFQIGVPNDLPKLKHAEIDTQILKGKRILLVEDNDLNRVLANTILSQYGADVEEAVDGSIAIEKFEQSDYDLILMDVQMPVKDGLETTRYIRSVLNSPVPIIALTANAFKAEEERCINAGMNDFVSKPFDENRILQVVAQWLVTETNFSSSPNAPAADDSALYDLGKLKSIGRGDDAFLRKMLELFLDTTPEMLSDMQNAFDKIDWATLAAAAHRLKASINTLCIKSLEKDIDVLEDAKTKNHDKIVIQRHLNNVLYVMNEAMQKIRAEL